MDTSEPGTRAAAASADVAMQTADSDGARKPHHPIAHTAVMCGLAENPALPPDLVDVLIRHGDEQILTEFATRADLTDRHIEDLAASGRLLVVTSLVNAGRIAMPTELLEDEDVGSRFSWRVLTRWPAIRLRCAVRGMVHVSHFSGGFSTAFALCCWWGTGLRLHSDSLG